MFISSAGAALEVTGPSEVGAKSLVVTSGVEEAVGILVTDPLYDGVGAGLLMTNSGGPVPVVAVWKGIVGLSSFDVAGLLVAPADLTPPPGFDQVEASSVTD